MFHKLLKRDGKVRTEWNFKDFLAGLLGFATSYLYCAQFIDDNDLFFGREMPKKFLRSKNGMNALIFCCAWVPFLGNEIA
jgi:hypothetical protein